MDLPYLQFLISQALSNINKFIYILSIFINIVRISMKIIYNRPLNYEMI